MENWRNFLSEEDTKFQNLKNQKPGLGSITIDRTQPWAQKPRDYSLAELPINEEYNFDYIFDLAQKIATKFLQKTGHLGRILTSPRVTDRINVTYKINKVNNTYGSMQPEMAAMSSRFLYSKWDIIISLETWGPAMAELKILALQFLEDLNSADDDFDFEHISVLVMNFFEKVLAAQIAKTIIHELSHVYDDVMFEKLALKFIEKNDEDFRPSRGVRFFRRSRQKKTRADILRVLIGTKRGRASIGYKKLKSYINNGVFLRY